MSEPEPQATDHLEKHSMEEVTINSDPMEINNDSEELEVQNDIISLLETFQPQTIQDSPKPDGPVKVADSIAYCLYVE